jgi:excisionase family DNA binding protein
VTLDELTRAGRNFATVAETCAILDGADERTLYSMIERKEIPATRVGNRWKIPVTWLREQAGITMTETTSSTTMVPEQLADAVADRVVARLARVFAALAAGTAESP